MTAPAPLRDLRRALAAAGEATRDAIGWALRSYAWTDPGEVARYVKSHAELSALPRREALKNVGG